MDTVPRYKNKNERQQAFKQIMHRLNIECFGIKFKKIKSSPRFMRKYKHKKVKELSDYAKAHTKKKYNLQEGLVAEKSVAMKVKKGMGSTNGTAERCTIFDPVTDKNEILSTTLKYNIGVLTKTE